MGLKSYLLINGCFSFFSGTLMLILNEQLNFFFDISNPMVLTVIGVNLIVFSFFVLFVALAKPIKKLLVQLIVVLDILWVLGSVFIIIFALFDLSNNGYKTIGIVALFIGFLALKQFQHSTQKEPS